MDSAVAFIPVRGGSKSISLKNIKLINGRPLVYWVLDAAVNCEKIERVYVSTDDERIAKVVKEYGSSQIEIISRSLGTATDTASTESAMLEFAENANLEFETIVLLQATSPLTTKEDIKRGLEKYQQPHVDSVLSVVRQKRFIWQAENTGVKPVNYDYMNRPRRQDFSGYLVENGAIYITSRKALLHSKCRLSGNVDFIEMSDETYYELDEPADWIIVEQMLKNATVFCEQKSNLKAIKMLLTDCDGVLTDGGMYYSESSDELKKYNTRDGMGIRLLRESGIIVGIVTGESRELVRRRAEKLQIDELHMAVEDKCQILGELAKKYQLDFSEIAYIGDDINDLGIMRQVGFACSVADGMECAKHIANYITKANGGTGAVREVAELILAARKHNL